MTGPSTRDSGIASTAQQRSSGNDRPGGSRVFAVGSLGAVLLSTVISSVAYGLLPDLVRIHWTLGTGPYYGPEFAPSVVVLAAFPVLVAATALGAYWGAAKLGQSAEFATIRTYYVVAVFAMLAALLGTQVALVIANL